MASPYQQQAFQRKLVYLGCIIVLFTGAWLWRHYAVEVQANNLAIREINRGDVNLSDKFVRLSLSGSRGVVVCYLWMTAIDNQKKNQWNELEKNVGMLTTMQPHFIKPWLFQSWNLSYNVSVSLDRVSDKYFYIARGIQYLAEGERQNHDNPDIRWNIGFYYQHKICQHDETNVLRSLFQLSCIPPNERDPNRFLIYGDDGQTKVNLKEFEQFCKDHPQLVRRLHSGIQRETKRDNQRQFRCTSPESVVRYLADNYKILTLYETPDKAPPNAWTKKEDKLLDETERFPILPPVPGKPPRLAETYDANAFNIGSTLNDGTDAYGLARSWYSYSMEPVPPPGDLPGENSPITDRVHQRVPKYMMTPIFRQQTARAASYQADRLQQEGWFEPDAGKTWQSWPIPDWFDDTDLEKANKFSDGSPAEVRVDQGRLPKDAWIEAYKLWQRDGDDNHFLVSPARDNQLKQLSKEFRKRMKLKESDPAPNKWRYEDLPLEDRDKLWEEYSADLFLRVLAMHRRVTNFQHHYIMTLVEREDDTIKARGLFYQADTKRINAEPHLARRLYENPAAMPAWRAILLKPGNEEFRKDMLIQEDTAEVQLKYFDLVNEELKPKTQRAAAALPLGTCFVANALSGSLVQSPFLDAEGKPIIEEMHMRNVVQRRVKPGAKPKPKPAETEEKSEEKPK